MTDGQWFARSLCCKLVWAQKHCTTYAIQRLNNDGQSELINRQVAIALYNHYDGIRETAKDILKDYLQVRDGYADEVSAFIKERLKRK